MTSMPSSESSGAMFPAQVLPLSNQLERSQLLPVATTEWRPDTTTGTIHGHAVYRVTREAESAGSVQASIDYYPEPAEPSLSFSRFLLRLISKIDSDLIIKIDDSVKEADPPSFVRTNTLLSRAWDFTTDRAWSFDGESHLDRRAAHTRLMIQGLEYVQMRLSEQQLWAPLGEYGKAVSECQEDVCFILTKLRQLTRVSRGERPDWVTVGNELTDAWDRREKEKPVGCPG